MRRLLLLWILCIGAATALADAGGPYDVIIRGGTVYDGNGADGVEADVGIRGDRIVAVGALDHRGTARIIDATGLAVTPGFVDIHSHAVRGRRDNSGLFLHPNAENVIRQGVTTVIGGPDGRSWYPIGELLDMAEDAPSAINFGTMVGHNRVREEVMGRADRDPTDAELERMKTLVDRAMRDGAFGLSSGLKYVPGAYSKTGEVIELAKVAGEHGGIYISHVRDEGRGMPDSVAEVIRIAEEGGLPGQVTHHKAMGRSMWGTSVDSLAQVDAARARGLDITSDAYPYTASSTGIKVLFPPWVLEGDRETREARLRDPAQREAIMDGLVASLGSDRGGGDLDRVAIASCSWNPDNNGKTLGELLDERGVERTPEAAAALLIELELGGSCTAVYHSMDEADVVRILTHPTTMVASDGGIAMPGPDVPHPRNYGAFARVLGVYVREKGVLTLPEAIHKMSAMPADRLGLPARGRIEPGAFADVVVLDPETIADRATFKNPHQFAVGVRHVLVNGVQVLADGEVTGEHPGRVLKMNRARGPFGAPLPPLRVLFVGNSFSFYNNGIHTHFRNFLRAAGDDWVVSGGVKMLTISGGRLEQNAPGLDLLLDQYDWDVVVLQGHSREAIDPERADGFRDAVTAMSDAVRGDGAEPVLYMTWAYRDEPSMTGPIAEAYQAAGATNDAGVAPVGLAFARAREALPDLELFVADGRHPTLAGTYLAAAVFYAKLMGASPAGLDYDAGLDPDTAAALRDIAWATVQAQEDDP